MQVERSIPSPFIAILVFTVAATALLVLSDDAQAAVYSFDLALTDPVDEKTYIPPDAVAFNLTVRHTGDQLRDVVIVQVLNLPTGWSTNLLLNGALGISAGTSTLDAELVKGETATLSVTVTPKAGMVNGTYWFTIKVYAEKDVTSEDSLDLGVTITSKVDFSIAIHDAPSGNVFMVTPPDTVAIRFVLFNLGNSGERYRITVLSSMCQFGWVARVTSGADGQGWTPVLASDPLARNPHYIDVELVVPDVGIAGTSCMVTVNATSEQEPGLERAPATAIIKLRQIYAFSVNVVGEPRRSAQVGETVVFQLRISNQGNGLDTFRVFAAWIEEDVPGWFARPNPTEVGIAAGENATVDYLVKLAPNATLGSFQFHAQVWSSSTELASVQKSFTVTVLSHYDVEVYAMEATRSADPGDRVYFHVLVENLGNTLDSVNLSWDSTLEGWLTYIQPPSVTLVAGERSEVNVSLVVPEDLGDAPRGTYRWLLLASSVGGGGTDAEELSVRINPFGRVELLHENATLTSPAAPVASPAAVRPKPVIDLFAGTTVAITLHVANLGVTDDNVTLWGHSPDPRVQVSVLPETHRVHPGATQEVYVQISVPGTMFPGEHRVWVNASSSFDGQAMRAVPVEFDVVPIYNPGDFADMRADDPLSDDYSYSYSIEGNEVVSARGRRGKHPEMDIVSVTAVFDLATNNVTVTLELHGAPSRDQGIFYGVYFVTADHRVTGALDDPASHRRGDLEWETHDEANTIAFVYLSDQQMGSSSPMTSMSGKLMADRVVWTFHARDLRRAGVEPGSGFHLYAYCHRLGSTGGGEAETRLVYDTAGTGALDAPWDFTREPEEVSYVPWILAVVAVVAALALLFVYFLPRLMPPEPEPEHTEADDWVEYR